MLVTRELMLNTILQTLLNRRFLPDVLCRLMPIALVALQASAIISGHSRA